MGEIINLSVMWWFIVFGFSGCGYAASREVWDKKDILVVGVFATMCILAVVYMYNGGYYGIK